MKKYLFVATLLILLMTAGCGKIEKEEKPSDKAFVNENEKTVIKSEKKSDFREELKRLNLKRDTYGEQRELIKMQWIEKYLEFMYNDIAITDISFIDTGNYDKYFDIHSDNNLKLRLEKVFIQFNSDKSIENLELNADNMYIDEVYMVLADLTEDGDFVQYYLDVIDEDNIDFISVFEYGIKIIAGDDRFNSGLDIGKLKKENNLSNNVKIIDRNKIMDAYEMYSMGIHDNEVFLLMGKPIKIDKNNVLHHDVKICIYDYDNNKIISSVDIDDFTGENFYFNYKNGFNFGIGEEHYTIDFNGNVTAQNNDEEQKIYSADGKLYAYSDEKGNLYIKNSENDKTVICLESVTDENKIDRTSEYNAYNAYQWIDDNRLIYTMTGYEWSNGFGIINADTKENTILDNSLGKQIYKVMDDKLYAGYFAGYGETFPYNFGYYDLSTLSYSYYKVYDAEDKRDIYETEGENIEFLRRLSSDISKLYIFSYKPQNYEFFVKTFSFEENDIISETRFNISEYLPSEFIEYSNIINDKTLIICDRINVYIIDL